MLSRYTSLFVFLFLFFCQSASALQEQSKIEAVFQKLITKASQSSNELQAAYAISNQKSAEYYTAWSRWIPKLDLTLSQTRTKDFSFLSSGTLGTLANTLIPQTTDLKRWELDLTFPIYSRWIHLGINQVASENRLAKEKLKILETELNGKLRALLGDYLLKTYKTATLENAIQMAKTQLKDAELRFNLGQRTKVDLLRAQSNHISLLSKKIVFQADQDTSLNSLLEYSGLSSADLQRIELNQVLQTESEILQALNDFTRYDDFFPAISELLETPSLEKQMVHSSLVYQQFVTEEELNERRTENLMAGHWPELLLQGSLNQQSPHWKDTKTSDNQSYAIAVLLKIPLFSGGSFLSNRFEMLNAQKANRLNSEKNILHFKNTLENDRIQIQALLKSLEAQKLRLNQNDEIVLLSLKSYQLGKTTLVELLGSQNDLIDVKIALAQTKIELVTLLRHFAWNLGVKTP